MSPRVDSVAMTQAAAAPSHSIEQRTAETTSFAVRAEQLFQSLCTLPTGHSAISVWTAAASIFPIVMLARFRTSQIAVVVDFETPAGQAAWTTVPALELISTTRNMPAGDQGMSQQR